MKKSDFHYELPVHLIAQYPTTEREQSRLLVLDGVSGALQDRRFEGLPQLLKAGDLLVFNDTRVIPARLYGEKSSGGKVEVLIERVTGQRSLLAQIRASKAPKPGVTMLLEQVIRVRVLGREGAFYQLEIENSDDAMALLDRHGHLPLPPYIQREDKILDRERYQTVYARQPGAVAAPTAGLHFSRALLQQLQQQGVQTAFVTLHVGAGTFQPVRCEHLRNHRMHEEYYEVSERTCERIAACKQTGGRVIAVGTTSVRCLESAAADGQLRARQAQTKLFITPGYQFRVVDALITNFHLPESTLLMLVSAFAGRTKVMAAYQHAIANEYRFFSYGDAMFITPARLTEG